MTSDINLHTFIETNYYHPTFCNLCGGLLVGLFKQGLKCKSKQKHFFSLSFQLYIHELKLVYKIKNFSRKVVNLMFIRIV